MSELLSEQASEDFRALALIELLNNPLDWRLRRTDRFGSASWIDIEQVTLIDFRIKRSFVRQVLMRLLDAYPDGTKTHEEVELALAAVERQSRNCSILEAADLILPIAWLSNPQLKPAVHVNGAEVVPFSRREAADVFARFFASLMKSAAVLNIVQPEPAVGLWRDLGWCLTATDVVSLQSRNELRGLPRPSRVSSGKAYRIISDWIVGNYEVIGHSRHEAKAVIKKKEKRIRYLLGCVEENAGAWELLDDRSAFSFAASRRYSPCVNPLLLHFSFMKRVLWEIHKNPIGAQSRPAIEPTLDYFLSMCEHWLSSVEQVRRLSAETTTGDHTGLKIGQYALRYSLLLGDSWPMLARVNVPLEQNCRVQLDQVIPTSSPNAFSAAHASPQRSRASQLLDFFARRPVRDVSQLVRHALDSFLRFFGLTPNIYLQKGTQQYALTLNDAASYHVEVSSNSPELELVPNAAFVKLPQINYFSPLVQRLASGTFVSLAFPLKKVPASSVFGRVVDGNRRIHSFYTTKTSSERLSSRAAGQDELGLAPYLVVRYAVAGYVRRINAWVSYAVLAFSIVYARLVLLETGHIGVSGVNTADLSKIVASSLLSVLLLFAFERRNNLLVAAYIRRYSYVVLAAFAIFATALIFGIVILKPSALPHLVPLPLVSAMQVWCVSAAAWFLAHEARLYLAILLVAVLLPLLLVLESAAIWLLSVAVGIMVVAIRRLLLQRSGGRT